VPFDAGGETEQSLRAEGLQRLSGIVRLSSGDLSPETLAAAVKQAKLSPVRKAGGFSTNGAEKSVDIAEAIVGGHAK